MVRRKPGCAAAVVAGCTIIGDSGMVEHRRAEGAGYVADSAILVGSNMPGILAGCSHPVTGIAALADYVGARVIDDRGYEGELVVAVAAIAGYRNMIDRHADRATGVVITVVAGSAIAGDFAVIENTVGEGGLRMADVTIE